VTPDLTDLAADITIDPRQAIGIPLALIGAVFLSLGAQFQHRGVNKVEANTVEITGGLNTRQLRLLLARPSWVFGTVMLGLAIVLQLTSLNARVSKVSPTRASLVAIALCIGGVGLFVTVAAFTAVDKAVTDSNLVTILIMLGIVLVAFGITFFFLRNRFKAIFYIIGAGVVYGFVATLAKVIINRMQHGNFEWLTLTCLLGLLLAAGLGAYFVQNAYASGPPDLVIAGLTVVDPLVAVGIGIVVLGEASQAPLWASIVFAVAGIVAIWGVFLLAKYHPQSEN
jgi:drug/metabolite transporter (DMT)-like permease